MRLSVYTDGSAQTAPNPGGWGVVVLIDDKFHTELSGHLTSATNNDAELVAAIKGLDYALELIASQQSSFPTETEVTLISDSEIVLNWANGKYKFKQIDKIALYEHLIRLVKKMKVKTQWIKGHSGNIWNSRCDKLANNARKGVPEDGVATKIEKSNSKIGSKKSGVVSVWFAGKLKIIDFDLGIVEDYNREAHGKRGSVIEIREGKER